MEKLIDSKLSYSFILSKIPKESFLLLPYTITINKITNIYFFSFVPGKRSSIIFVKVLS